MSGTGTVRRPILLFPYSPIGQSYSKERGLFQGARAYRWLAIFIPPLKSLDEYKMLDIQPSDRLVLQAQNGEREHVAPMR